MALTATATPHVEQEIINNLGLRNPFVAKTSFNRSNLHYSVRSPACFDGWTPLSCDFVFLEDGPMMGGSLLDPLS